MAGTGLLAGLVNPGYLLFTFSRTGSGQSNPCAAAVEEAMVMKDRADKLDALPVSAKNNSVPFLAELRIHKRFSSEFEIREQPLHLYPVDSVL